MPIYNEAGCIEKVSHSWLALLDCFPHGKFFIVDDGSRDNSGVILEQIAASDPRLIVIHQTNQGHGAALVKGYRTALSEHADWIFQVDSDDQFEPSDFWKLWEKRDHSLIVLGFRQERHDALHRLIITRLLRLFNLFVFQVWIKDVNIPYRLLRADFCEELLKQLPPEMLIPNIFLSVLASRALRSLQEVPVTHRERATGQVSAFSGSKCCSPAVG